MDKTAKTIGLFGLFGGGNLGNDASLQAIAEFFQTSMPDTKLVCICVEPQRVSETFGIAAIDLSAGRLEGPLISRVDRLMLKGPSRVMKWVWAVRALRKMDALVIPGTGILDDFGAGPFGLPYGVFRWSLAARLAGAKVYYLSIGAGPIHHPLSRGFMKRAAAAAIYRSYRDQGSKTFMINLGVRAKNDPVYPDLAFRLSAPNGSPVVQDFKVKTVGLGVMAYYGWTENEDEGQQIYKSYLEKITSFAQSLLANGYNIRLLTGQTPDEQTVQDVIGRLRHACPGLAADRIVSNPLPTLRHLMHEIAHIDVAVVTRFHNVVAALMMGKPTVSIGYAKKNDALMGQVGLEKFCQYIETLDVERLTQQFNEVIEGHTALAQGIEARVLEFRQQLAKQDSLLKAMLTAT